MARKRTIWAGPRLALLVAGLVTFAVDGTAQTGAPQPGQNPWWDSLQGKIGHVTGDLEPRFTLDDEAGTGTATGGGGNGAQPETAGPPGTTPINPQDPRIAALIIEWIRTAQPPENVTEGARFRYSNAGAKIGTTRDGGIITAPHDPPGPDPVWLWTNRRGLDSVDHCTMEEFVVARASDQSIAGCRGRYRPGPDIAGTGPATGPGAGVGTGAGTGAGAGVAGGGAQEDAFDAALVGAWTFGRVDGPFLCNITLSDAPGGHGRVIKACHPNESFWRIEGGSLVFLDNRGRVTSRLSRRNGNDWQGPYVLEPARQIVHYIRRAASETGEAGDDIKPGAFEPGIDRMGGDYHSFWLPNADPALCKAQCDQETQCRAWTYVVPGHQGTQAKCWLKSTVPNPREDKCCVSGVKPGDGETAQTPVQTPVQPPAETPAQTPTQTPAQAGASYFVGLWGLSPSACSGKPPPPKPASEGQAGTIGEAIVEGVGEAIEQAFATMGFSLAQDGSYSLVNIPTGESAVVGSWSYSGNILSFKSEAKDVGSGDARVLERHSDRFVVIDTDNQEQATFWRCSKAAQNGGERRGQSQTDTQACSFTIDSSLIAGASNICDSFVERLDPQEKQIVIHLVNSGHFYKEPKFKVPNGWLHGRHNECRVLLEDAQESRSDHYRRECK